MEQLLLVRRMLRRKTFLVPVFIVMKFAVVYAQAPTSLNYPTPNVFIANVTNVYLSPTVAGNVTSYSISPALPAGLSFNTNTGVISGLPTAASPVTNYTITATGGSPPGSAIKTISILVTNNFFDNVYNNINFGGGSGTTLVTITPKVGTGTSVGNIVLYENVAQLSGIQIDCIVKTRSLTGGSFTNFDQPLITDGSTFNNNDPRFFSPQLTFNAGGGSAIFDFQFILGNSYNNTTNTGTPVVLQNVKVNTYDIDGNGTTNSNQANEFDGFSTSELSNSTTIQAPTFNTTTNLTRYRSNVSTNNTTVTADATRVRLTYNNISDFSILVSAGATGAAYYFIDFGAGPAFSAATTITQAPTADLNTDVIGVNNGTSGCGSALSFTASSQTNITSTTNLTQLTISFPAASIADGANETFTVNGATSGGTIPLDSDGSTSVILGGNTYTAVRSSSSGVRTVTFTTATFTVAKAEALLDAIRYLNSAGAPTSGDRNFTVNVRTSAFESPDAIFTATLNCVSISGNIYHDVNGMTDGLVNASGTQFGVNAVYAVRVDPATNLVIDTRGVAAGGSYNFGTATPGSYILYVSNTSPAAGTLFTAATYPAGGYVSTGENLGADAGTDLLADGKLLITVGSISVSDANFGIEIPPVTTNNTLANQPNPGGYNFYTVPNAAITASDADGEVSSITITEFPSGANYLKVGSVVYPNPSGGICPPLTTCTAWPGTLVVPYSGGVPVQSIAIDPSADVSTSVTIKFSATDNGGLSSSAVSTLSIPFVVTSYYTVSGNVWNDYDGNGIKAAGEPLTNVAGSGETLYALLLQNNNTYAGVPTVFQSATVSSTTGYSFTGVPGGNNYEVRIVSQAAAPAAGSAGSAVIPNLAPGWKGVSLNKNGTVSTVLNTTNPVLTLNGLAASIANQNFGIERTAVAEAKSFTNVNTGTGGPVSGANTNSTRDNAVLYHQQITMSGSASSGSVPGILTGTDPDGNAGGTSLPIGSGTSGISLLIDPASYTNTGSSSLYPTMLYYNGVQLQPGGCLGSDIGKGFCSNYNAVSGYWEIPGYDGSQLTLLGTNGTTQMGFSYGWKDAAGATGAMASYQITFNQALPLDLLSFTATDAGNELIILQWHTANEFNTARFDVEFSASNTTYSVIGTVTASGESAEHHYTYGPVARQAGWYRLAMYDKDGSRKYSGVIVIKNTSAANEPVIYPNPAARYEMIRLKYPVQRGRQGSFVVYNSLGVPVYANTLSVTGLNVLPSKQWPAGLYHVKIVVDGSVNASQFILR
ncbi:MAG: putative Ig domain-containing protein [Chitinophagaceae bacterium]|nr:putative Ig domain-containing protein [Chitinophagaceae bacterium]